MSSLLFIVAGLLLFPASFSAMPPGRPRASIRLLMRLKLNAGTLVQPACQVRIGRLSDNTVVLPDVEVSGYHALLRWHNNCWRMADLGSLNGTLLNGFRISCNHRRRSKEHRLSSDDIVQFGSSTRVKVAFFGGGGGPSWRLAVLHLQTFRRLIAWMEFKN
jgi:pSer/pThr/pTyr-binding forkhead associated (FHA) protein